MIAVYIVAALAVLVLLGLALAKAGDHDQRKRGGCMMAVAKLEPDGPPTCGRCDRELLDLEAEEPAELIDLDGSSIEVCRKCAKDGPREDLEAIERDLARREGGA